MAKDKDKNNDKPVAGTANVLKQTKTYEHLVEEFGEPAANGMMAKAINDVAPVDRKVTATDVGGFAKVTTAMRTLPVDVTRAVDQGMAVAKDAVNELLSNLGKESGQPVEPVANPTPETEDGHNK
ncbi:hypothetical protein KAM385_45740 [Aeromonas hydrophila]|uniref:hypothetical protein n=1 Tax=Aeromonas hydrophila TaxID=644 RepID=UPI001CC3E55D|nr:hypothetical protein [Aeromonas hydrophila]GJC07545.1 hypothetical protein KAM385_45740 [Aeromonas hydrophila]